MTSPYGLVYGPHTSRRLGVSLGVDLSPMTCTFNCIYCERGKTRFGCKDFEDFTSQVAMDGFQSSLRQRMKTGTRFDCLTFAGTGEPTLDLRLGEFITVAKKIIGKRVIKVITNSSLLNHDKVIRNLTEADEVIVKLNTVSDEIFNAMYRPYNKSFNVEKSIKGLHLLKRKIKRRLTIEVLFFRSYQQIQTNHNEIEVKKITQILQELEPGSIQIHTIRRFPAEPYVLQANRRFLDMVAIYMQRKLPKTKVLPYI
jgi:wyosine [tRNA(Phe)-imidazoG37] synthetase (radical SAM superfamily)